MSREDETQGRPTWADAGEVLAALPDGVVVADRHGVVEFLNARAAKLIGRAESDVVGEHIVQALPLLDEAGRSWWHISDPWRGLDIRTGHRERMLLLPGRGQVLVTMTYLREVPRGPVVRVVVALRDTDARRRAEAENAELISLVAHELRAPLASVKGFSTTLLKRWNRFTDEQKHLMIETIEADAERLARLIHELLDVSRLDTSRLRLERRGVDLRVVVRRCIDRLVASGLDPARFEVTVDTPAPDGDVVVWGDPDRLDQIMTNLLENAVQHGSGTVHVRLEPLRGEDTAADAAADSCGPDAGSRPAAAVAPVPGAVNGPGRSSHGACWVVSVDDEGDGVRPEHYSLVFGKFWHGSRRGSTGLGLYLVRGLVEAHGGSISVDRGPHGGALFRFTVPGAPRS